MASSGIYEQGSDQVKGYREGQMAGGATEQRLASQDVQRSQGVPMSSSSQSMPSLGDSTGTGSGVGGGSGNVSVATQYLISDPLYQPQERIVNMPYEVQEAFKSQYTIASFNGMPVLDKPVEFLTGLEQVEGVRIAYFPVPKDILTSGAGGDVVPPSSSDQAALKDKKDEKQTSPSSSTSIPVSTVPSASASSQGTGLAVSPQQGMVKSGGNVGAETDALPYSNLQALPPTVRTRKNFTIYGTSVVRELELQTPLPEEHWEGSPAPLSKEKMNVSSIMFTNVSQLPSSDNRTGKNQPMKPCMHLFLFSACSPTPIVIVERYLRERSRALRVFNSDLGVFGAIECTSTFKWMGRKKVVITGPDSETPIFTIKSKFNFGPGTASDFVIKRGKKKVGMITSRYTTHDPKDKSSAAHHTQSSSPPSGSASASAHTGNVGSTTTNLAPASAFESLTTYDLFFPKPARWPSRIMLIIAALYMDYLMSD